MPSIAIQFARFGPYHLARINSAFEALSEIHWSVIGLETAGCDTTYEWKQEIDGHTWKRHTVFPNDKWELIPKSKVEREICSTLNALKPDAVAISGWGSSDARACLNWCAKNGSIAIAMSETREGDGTRSWLKERLKSHIIQKFDGGLVGSRSHRDYLSKLGIPSEKIRLGYNVVDNNYFRTESSNWRKADRDIEIRPYFLASNRFIERKNLDRLISAFAKLPKDTGWDLCLLGDGELRNSLVNHCGDLDLGIEHCASWESHRSDKIPNHPTVYFPGFRQIEELPRFYAHAGCFIHPALEEPWGLVINEAMACGLPILSSSNVGAAEELVDEGVNGWKFEPGSLDSITSSMEQIAALKVEERHAMGSEGSRILEDRCPTRAFGEGLAKCLEVAGAL